jgi:hypothetical protein
VSKQTTFESLNNAHGVAVDINGTVYIADSDNNRGVALPAR